MKIRSGLRKPRVKRPVEKDLVTGYDSNFEYQLHQGILKTWDFHSETVDYIIEHTYHPDFIKEIDGKKCEPIEMLTIDAPEDCMGKIIEIVSQRKGEIKIMEPKGDLTHCEFEIPSRGIIGLRDY